jgi:hypothetical protein
MSPTNRRTRLSKLSLVSGTGVPRPADDHAASAPSLPEGWFCDEVGFVSETADADCIPGPVRPEQAD